MKQPFTSKGFAYIFNLEDYNNNLIKKKLNENELQIAHNKTRIGSLIKITNPKTAQSLFLKNNKNFN